MRLIDADIFTEECRKKLDMQALYSPLCIKGLVVDKMPTVEAEPVRRGKWEKYYFDHVSIGERPYVYYCTNCNAVGERTAYCPHCGAKMGEVK